MGQITVRGLDPEIENKIRQIAKTRHLSINSVLTEIIHQTLGEKKRKPAAATLKSLAGTWSRQEGDNFINAIAWFEQIDEEIW